VLAFARLGTGEDRPVVCLANLVPVVREGHRVGLPRAGAWRERLNTDAAEYGGSGVGNAGAVHAAEEPWHDQPASAQVTLPPLGVLWLVPDCPAVTSRRPAARPPVAAGAACARCLLRSR
jgi:1,4-alpha-glucan branching enzyme